MNKINQKMFVFIASFIMMMASGAQVSNLWVSYDYDQGSKGEYVYKGTCKNRPYWVGPKGKDKYAIVYSSNAWSFGQWSGDTTNFFGQERNYSNSMTLPLTGWMPWLSIEVLSAKLTYSGTILNETKLNDGNIGDTLYIAHNKFNGQTFSGSNGSDFVTDSKVNLYNIPAGLTLKMVKQTDTLMKVYFTGSASNHAIDTNFSIQFKDAAFSNGGKADSTQNDSMFIKLNFRNALVVAKSGGDFSVIADAFKNAGSGDIIMIKEGVYTENSIAVTKPISDLIIYGEGADKTIIQADTAPNIAAGRVFNVQSISTAEMHDLTIQNGNVVSNNGYAGGILANTLYLYGCRILNNRAFSNGAGQTIGGGIQASNLYLYNTEIAGNIADNGNKSGQILGGGAYCSGTCMVTNSTISGNYSRTDCGGIILGNGIYGVTNKVVNSTITNNVAELGNGGGIYTYGMNEFINSIVWGNTAVKGKDLYQVNSHVYAVYSIRSIIGDTSGNLGRAKIIGSFVSTDPKLDTLKFNCSVTRTHALLQGSSALDSGVMADSIPALDQRGWAPFNNKDIGALEMVYQIQFEIGKDTVCIENNEVITLKTNTNGGTFEGDGVVGNTFDVSKITKTGFVTITFKYSAPGCENFNSSDSIYVKTCTPSKVKNFASLNASIFPNPANDQITVKHNVASSMNVTFFDLSGKSLAKYSSNENSMNISLKSFTAGMYLVMVESNGLKSTHKLIKN